MSTIGSVNLALELFGGISSLIIFLCLLANGRPVGKQDRTFLRFLACNILIQFGDIAALLFRGKPGLLNRFAVQFSNFLVFSLGYIFLAVFTNYLVSYLAHKKQVARAAKVIWGICAASVGLVVLNLFFPIYYIIDETNTYQRLSGFWVSQALGILCMLLNAAIVVLNRKTLNRRERFWLLAYHVLPVIAMIIQSMVYGLALLNVATTLSILMLYVGLQAKQAQDLKEKELELTENRVAIMLSQIQPHFIYNSMVVIKHLCDADPDQAKEAITEFSEYLRGNLDSLTQKETVPFEKELEHVKRYLSLEQKRFQEKLAVRYDIQATGFYIPALTLQPIVENAVRYGVTKKDGGGSIAIRVREKERSWQIVVEDDGVGFEPNRVPLDGRSHIGIENVRNRLKTMSGGALSIASKPGKGTTATIEIPKEGNEP